MKIRIDMNEFTLRDACDLEAAGFTFADLEKALNAGRAPTVLLPVVIWIFHRKEDKAFTLEDAMNVRLTDGIDFEVVEVDDNPKAERPDGGSLRSVSPPAGRRKRSTA